MGRQSSARRSRAYVQSMHKVGRKETYYRRAALAAGRFSVNARLYADCLRCRREIIAKVESLRETTQISQPFVVGSGRIILSQGTSILADVTELVTNPPPARAEFGALARIGSSTDWGWLHPRVGQFHTYAFGPVELVLARFWKDGSYREAFVDYFYRNLTHGTIYLRVEETPLGLQGRIISYCHLHVKAQYRRDPAKVGGQAQFLKAYPLYLGSRCEALAPLAGLLGIEPPSGLK